MPGHLLLPGGEPGDQEGHPQFDLDEGGAEDEQAHPQGDGVRHVVGENIKQQYDETDDQQKGDEDGRLHAAFGDLATTDLVFRMPKERQR